MNLDIEDTLQKLFAHHGREHYEGPDDILGVLVRTILSQQTTRHNCRRAFGNLVDSFGGDWDRIRRAPLDELVEVIAVAGLARQKGRRIQALLERLDQNRGDYDLEFVREMDVEQAREYLTQFKGVGPKTAAFVLMYAAGMSAFPMDTHIFRICKRLGLLDESTGSQAAHRRMEELIPARDHYSAHMVLVRHGRRICHAQNPECERCPLREPCPFPQSE